MTKLQSVIILLLNLLLVTGHELKQKLNHISDKSGAVEETDHRHQINGIDGGKEIDSNKVDDRNDESEALRMLSPVLDFVQSLTDRIDRIHDKVNIDHIQHSKQYQKENHQSFDYSQKYGYNNNYWNYRNPNEVNGMKIVNVTGVKNGDVKHGKVMEWNRFDPDIINNPGEYKILDHNGQDTGDVKVEYTLDGKPWDPNTADLWSLVPKVNLGLDDDPGIDINSKGENRDKKYKTMPIWPGGNREKKYKTMPIKWPRENKEKKYEYLPTYGIEELKKRKKERLLSEKHSKKIYNRQNIVTVHDKSGSYTISKHLEFSGDWNDGNHNEINGVKIVNVTGIKNGDIKHGKVLEWNRFDPLIINDPGEYKILDQNGRETGNIKINYTTLVDGIPWDSNEDIYKEERHSLYADTNNQGKRGYSKTKYTNRYVHKGYSSFGNKRWRRQNNGRSGLHHNINKNIDQDILVKDKKKDENNIIFDDQELYTESGRRWFSMVYQLLRKYALGDKTSLVPIF